MSQIDDARDMLVKTFPACFVPSGFPKKALRRGIDRELARRGIMSESKARQFLRAYCNGPRYLRALVEGAHRIGLDGEHAGGITEEERERARQALVQIEAHRRAVRERHRYRIEAERRAGALRKVRPLLDALRAGDRPALLHQAERVKEILGAVDAALEPWAGATPPEREGEAA